MPVAIAEPAVETSRHRRYRHRKRKKFWKRPSWWATIGKAVLVTLLGIAVLFGMWLVWSGMSSTTPH